MSGVRKIAAKTGTSDVVTRAPVSTKVATGPNFPQRGGVVGKTGGRVIRTRGGPRR